MSVLWAKRGWMSGGTFVPHQLFASSAQGAWYDPSDYSTLFQDAAGTTPVTAVEQPVRLMLDRSRGLVLGGELVVNGGFATDSDWTKGADWTISGGTANYNNAAAAQVLSQAFAMTAGRAYVVVYTVSALSSGFIYPRLQGSSNVNGVTATANGTYTDIIFAPASPTALGFVAQGVFSIDNVSVRELPGNHAVAPNDASRPVLRARYNLLTFSEQFDNAGWAAYGNKTITANSSVAPDGTTTADTFTSTAAGNGIIQINIAVSASTTYRFSLFAKVGAQGTKLSVVAPQYNSGSTYLGDLFSASPDINTGVALANGWYRHDFNGTTAATAAKIDIRIVAHANNDAYIIWGADLKTAADQTSTGGAYQRIAAATDYDVSNPVFRPYLAFDGTDDSFSTSAIDFSGTDEMTVFAGVTKLSDAAANGMICELGTGTENGIFSIIGPRDAATGSYRFLTKGTVLSDAFIASGYAAPITNVVTGLGDISADAATLRINGAQVATSATDQGSGNYANAALFIGRRNNSSNPLNGRLYSLAVLGRTATAPELSAMETWVNGKTGAF